MNYRSATSEGSIAPARAMLYGVLGLFVAAGLPQTAVAQATAPAPSTAAATSPASAPAAPANDLTFSLEERAILGGIENGDSQFHTTSLYILLSHAEKLAGRPLAGKADQPALDNLWEHPENYAGRLIRLRGYYAGLTEQQKVPSNPFFPGSTVYLLHMKVPNARESIVVALPQEPPKFPMGKGIEVSGFFYKLVSWQTRETEGENYPHRLFPVLVAPTVTGAAIVEPELGLRKSTYIISAIAGVMLLLIYLRWRRMRVPRPAPFVPPAPPEGDIEDDEVDPELRRAVEEAQAESNPPGPPKSESQGKP